MGNYVLEIPQLRTPQSQKKAVVFDENRNIACYVRRYYQNTFQKIGSYWQPQFFTNVLVEDAEGNLKVSIELISHFLAIREKWLVKLYRGEKVETFELIRVPKMRAAKIFEFEGDNKKLKIIDKNIGLEPFFYDEENNLLAKCKDRYLYKENHITIYSSEIDMFLVFGICYLIYLM